LAVCETFEASETLKFCLVELLFPWPVLVDRKITVTHVGPVISSSLFNMALTFVLCSDTFRLLVF
jgi:hypothetical protein